MGCNSRAERYFPGVFSCRRGVNFMRLSHASSKVRKQNFGRNFTMSDVALPGSIEPAAKKGPNLDGGINPLQVFFYLGAIAAALLFVAYSIYPASDASGGRVTSSLPYLMLF